MAKEIKVIEVIPYNSDWPKQFEHEANQIKNVLTDNCLAVHHVGSTSVPGLAAKPKIDIIAVVKDPEKSVQKLESIGFVYRGDYNIPMHYGFSKRGKVDVNLHVYQKGNPEIALNLAFRDYLGTHADIRDKYAALKLELLDKKSSYEKNDSMFTGYNLSKNAFILGVLKKTGYDRLRFVRCTHLDEWSAAKAFRQRYFFDNVPIADPYQWTFNHPDHVHFILYKGVEIIGYAHIQLYPESRAAIRIIVLDVMHRNQGFGKQFLEWMENWLKIKGYRSIQTESSPDALKYYEYLGYKVMPFNDPDGYESDSRDTHMGKLL